MKREVQDIGIPASAIDANKAYIQRWLKDAMEAGALDEDPDLVHRRGAAETPTPLASEHLEVQGKGKLPAPSSSGFRSSEPTVVGDTESRRPSALDEMLDSLSRRSVDDEPPVRVSLEAGPSISRKGTDLFDEKWKEISDVTGSEPDAAPSLTPRTPRRKSSGISTLMFKLFSSSQRIIKAASDGDPEEISRLLGLGVDVNTKDRWGWTAMSMAAYGGHEEGKSIGGVLLKSVEGLSHLAFPLQTQAQILTYDKVARVLMSHGATLDHEDVDGDTPYTLAFNKGHRNVVMMIEEETTRRATESADKPEIQERKASTLSLKKWKTR